MEKTVVNISDIAVPLMDSNVVDICLTCDFIDKEEKMIDISGGCSTSKILEEVLKEEILQFCKFLPHQELIVTATISNIGTRPKATVLVRPLPSSA